MGRKKWLRGKRSGAREEMEGETESRYEMKRDEGKRNKYNQMQKGPSITKFTCPKKNNMPVRRKGPLPHNKHQEGERMKNYFSKLLLNVSGRVIKFNCLEACCSFCKLPQIEVAYLDVK